MRRLLAILLLVATLWPAVAAARDQGRTPFDPGRLRVSLVVSGGNFLGGQYLVLGGGFHVYLLTGLEVGMDVIQWFPSGGATRSLTQISPQVRYVLWMIPNVHPYIGAYYRRAFIYPTDPDRDILGGRAGVMLLMGRSALVGIGGVYERTVSSCAETCTLVYPEVALALSF